MRRLTTQGEERKQQLIDEAAALFAERGYAETRVIAIVGAAGVAKGLFYWYFENKETLFRELVESIRLRLRQAQAAPTDPAAEPLVRLAQGSEASVRFMAEHAHFFALLQVENVGRQFTDVLQRGTEVHAADVAAVLQAGQADGTVRDDDAQLLAYGVVGTVGNFAHFHRSGRATGPIDELARFVARFVVRSVAADDDVARRVEAALAHDDLVVPLAVPWPPDGGQVACGRAGTGPGRDKEPCVATYQFLTDEWLTEAKRIREEYRGQGAPPAHQMKMNQVITDVPFGDGDVDAHMDTTGGGVEMDLGHIDEAELTVTLDYETAKAILVDQNPQAGMQAFMAGKIKVQGDMTKLMAMQQTTPDPVAQEIAEKIKEITQ